MESFDNRFTSQVDLKHIYMQFVKKEHLLVTILPDRIKEIYYTQARPADAFLSQGEFKPSSSDSADRERSIIRVNR
jgi:hypothetical protein